MKSMCNVMAQPETGNSRGRRFVFPCVVLCALALLTGCRTTGIVKPPPVVPVEPESSATVPAELAKALLSVELTAQPQDTSSTITASEVLNNLRSALVEDRFVVADQDGDVTLSVEVRAEEFDRTGNYFVFEGVADVQVRPVGQGALLGDRSFSVRAPRKLGREAAQRELGAELSRQIAPWAQETLAGLGAFFGVADLVVTVGRTTFNQPAYANRLLAAVRGMDGVRIAQLVQSSRQDRQITVRIVYEPLRIPDGLLFTLVSKHPELKLRLP